MLELNISAQPISHDPATDPENASIVAFAIHAGEICLTTMTNQLNPDANPKNGPYTSAYVVAQWIAHKWWRLRHEDKPDADLKETDLDWWEAHNIIASDAAYVLPNLYIWRNNDHIAIQSEPNDPDCYIQYHSANNGQPIDVSLESFDQAVDGFIVQTITLLEQRGFGDTDLHSIYRDVLEERNDPELAQIREAEARAGQDPPYQSDQPKDQIH